MMIKKWCSQYKIITTLTATAESITLYYSKTLASNIYFDPRKSQNLMLLFFKVLKEGDKFMIFLIIFNYVLLI